MKRHRRCHCLAVLVLAFGIGLTGCNRDFADNEANDPPPQTDWQPSESGDKTEQTDESRPTIDGPDLEPKAHSVETSGETISDDGMADFEVHEWGTFTSVQSSDGEYLPGLHHEEESLPRFVHQFAYNGVGETEFLKGIPQVFVPEPVTQKLETPVIYFYTDEPRQVDVTVDFPDGYITEWYPDSTGQNPTSPERVDREDSPRNPDLSQWGLDALADGQMSWSVGLTNQDRQPIAVPPDDIWAPSRDVPRAAYVEHEDQSEKFIFYRGIGRFAPEFRVTARRDGSRNRFTLRNTSDEAIPKAYFMKIHDGGGVIRTFDKLEPGESREFMPAPKELPKPAFVERAKEKVHAGLVDSGLTGPEAQAMVDTWEESYFQRNGHRVLYILPRTWTDRLLPISIDPTPDKLVRTLVGRVEVLTPRQEQKALQTICKAFETREPLYHFANPGGRFEEPLFRRGCQLLEAEETAEWCRSQVALIGKNTMLEASDQ